MCFRGRHIMMGYFANPDLGEEHVAEMRELPLEYGAKEDDSDRARWALRQSVDLCERIRFNNERHITETRNCEFLATGTLDDDF